MKKYISFMNNIDKDKLLHFFWSCFLLIPLILIFGSVWGCVALVVIAFVKELINDYLLNRGTPEFLDLVYGSLPVLIYYIYKLI